MREKNYVIVGLNTVKIMFVYKQERHRGLVEKNLITCLIAPRRTETSSVGPKTSPCGAPLSVKILFFSLKLLNPDRVSRPNINQGER